MLISLLRPGRGLCAMAAARHGHLCEHIRDRVGSKEMR